jgi:hypothetical protein
MGRPHLIGAAIWRLLDRELAQVFAGIGQISSNPSREVSVSLSQLTLGPETVPRDFAGRRTSAIQFVCGQQSEGKRISAT